MLARRSLVLGALATPLTGVANAAMADDYRPAVCSGRKPYVGPALHAPVTIGPVGEAAATSFDAPTKARFDAAFDKAKTATGAPSITATVMVPGRGGWSRTEAAGGASMLFWASAGKTMTATVVLQLAQDGKLSLDDPVSTWIEGVPNGPIVTVRDLLAHTSGLFSANEDLKVRAERRAPALDEQLRIARRHGPMFCPGERWRYTNTGYALLGEIVARVDGRSYADAIDARIIKPLGLTRMKTIRSGAPPGDVAPLFSAKTPIIDLSEPGAAGPIAASADDMVAFWWALLGGQLLKPAQVEAMFATLYPMFDTGTFYGLGVMAMDVPESGGGSALWLGHAGGAAGVGAMALYSPSDRAFVAVALTGDGSATATANLLLRQLRT
jgi:D-alanyl-D-alanine carboxypeptidase